MTALRGLDALIWQPVSVPLVTRPSELLSGLFALYVAVFLELSLSLSLSIIGADAAVAVSVDVAVAIAATIALPDVLLTPRLQPEPD